MMTSDDSKIYSEYDANIKIKEEPDAISETSASSSRLIPNLIKTVKTELGFSSNVNTTRLPSFRVPRDLTLGGNVKFERPKKIYVPNLNAQRNKNREDQNTGNKNEVTSKVNKGRNRDKGKGDKGKGWAKSTNNLVQSSGIFSEGIADVFARKHSNSSKSFFKDKTSTASGKETTITLERPKLSIPQKIDKAEEAEKLRELLRDDFVDDGVELDLENTPVLLPMIDEGTVFKNESSQTVAISKDHDNSISFQNEEAKIQNKIKLINPQRKRKEAQIPLSVPQVMENKSSTFILMQLPDCLPGLQIDDKQNDPRFKRVLEPSTLNETDKSNKFCTLNNLKEGMLGKLQILKSGKTRLLLGENDLLIDVGSNLSFRQDLIAVKISSDKQSGDLVNLGPVNSTLICSPDWENMLKKL